MIPVSTTTIAVKRPQAVDDPTDAPSYQTVGSGIRAHISTSRGREAVESSGSQEIVFFRLTADECDLSQLDTVVDEKTGEEYQVEWARFRNAVGGLEHVEAGLKQISGVVSRPVRSDL